MHKRNVSGRGADILPVNLISISTLAMEENGGCTQCPNSTPNAAYGAERRKEPG